MDETAQTENSREFYLAEYQALQNTMQFVRNDLVRTEAVSAVAVATIASWTIAGGSDDRVARGAMLVIALVITLAAGLRAISRNKSANRIARYLKLIEAALGEKRPPGGYEIFSHRIRSRRSFKYFQPLLVSRYLIWGAMFFGPIVLLTRL